MSFFDRFFRKQDEEEKLIRFGFDELDGWLKNERAVRRKKIYREAAPVLKEISGIVQGIKELALEIDSLECPTDIPERGRRVVETSKPEFVRGILDCIRDIEEKPDMEDIEAFSSKLQATLSTLPKVSMCQGRYLPLAFGGELEGVRKKCRRLFEMKKELDGLLEGDPLTAVEKDFRVLKGKSLLLPSLNKEFRGLRDDLKRLESEKAGLQGRMDGFLETDGFRDFSGRKEELKGVGERMEYIENRVYGLLTPLRRPLKVFKRFVLGKGLAGFKGIDGYIENPVEMFFSGEGGDIKLLFEEVRAALVNEELGFKAKERVKVVSRIDSVLDSDLEGLGKDFLVLRERREELTRELESSPVLVEKRRLGDDVERLGREVSLRKKEADKVDGKRNTLEAEIKELRADLEEKLGELMGCRVRMLEK